VDSVDIITALVALYGAVLATITFVHQRRKDRTEVTTTLSIGLEALPSYVSEPQLLLQAANTGFRPVTLGSGFLKLPDNRTLVFPNARSDVRFPHELQPGKSCLTMTDVREVANELRSEGFSGIIEIRAAYRDQTDKEYVSKPFKLNLNEWQPKQ
jgi:hypothetical protein